MVLTKLEADNILNQVYNWSNNKSFLGHNKHDGLNSAILKLFLGWSKWSRILAIQSVMRSPINIRHLLGVPETINPKGLALFLMGLLDRYSVSQNKQFIDQAEIILNLIYNSQSKGNWSGTCWGYSYPWQDLGFFSPAFTPNAVVTAFVCESLLKTYEVTQNEKYLKTVEGSIQFFLSDLPILKDTDDEFCLGYMPLPMKMRVLDVSILIGSVIAQYAKHTKDHRLLPTAKRLVNYVVRQQTEYHAWWYTDPPTDSLIRHDNYHTGFILDALWRYMKATGNWEWLVKYQAGLDYYAANLFNPDGSPRWMNDQDYPHDVHGSAQGLVTFSLALKNGFDYADFLKHIASWAVENLYNSEGRFYYQQSRYFTKKFTLMRWCNAWMFRGLAAALPHLEE